MTTGLMLAWISAVVGVAGLVAGSVLFMVPETAWRGMTRRGSRWANQASTAGCLLFVGLGLIGAGLLALSASDAWRGWQSTRWVETEAVVQAARIVEVRQIRSTNPAYRIEPVYRYRFEGRDYTASLVAFGDAASPDRETVEREMATRFATGATVRAYVNPSNPTEAVLEPGVQMKAMILGGLGLAFVVIATWQVRVLVNDWEGGGPEERAKREAKERKVAARASRRGRQGR